MQILIVKDEEGTLRPEAGTWQNDEGGNIRARIFLNKKGNQGCTVVECELKEKLCTRENCVLGHECLSGCQKDYDCPCLTKHQQEE